MICPQTQSNLYGFDKNETYSPSTITLPVRTDPYNIITEFYVIDWEFPRNTILERPWIHMMKVVPSSYHQLLSYLTSMGITDIRGDQAIPRSIAVVSQKKSGWTTKNLMVASHRVHSQRRNKSKSSLNSNHRAAGTERQTPLIKQRL